MNKIFNRPIAAIILLALISSYLFFFQLGKLALTDPDETFYAQTAKEMLQKNEWHTPYLYGKPQFEKPILFYLAAETSFKFFGVNEFSARLPSAVFGLLGVIAVYLLGAALFNRRAGFIAALILATNVEYIMLARACVTDMMLFTFITAGMLFFVKRSYLFCAAALGLATLTKGPIGLILPLAIIGSYMILARDFEPFRRPVKIFWSIIVYFAVAAPWYILMYKTHGNEFINVFFGFHNVIRFLEPEHKIGSQFYFYIPVILGGFFPWSAFLPLGIWRMVKAGFHRQDSAGSEKNNSILILSWSAVIFIFFSASSTKLVTYIFPLFAPLALIAAKLFDDFLNGGERSSIGRGIKASYYILLAATFIAAIGLYIFLLYDYPEFAGAELIAGSFLILGFALSLTAFLNKKFTVSFLFIIYGIILFLYPLNELVVPHLDRYETSKDVALKLNSLMKPGERLGSESNYRPGLAFYTDAFPVDLDPHHELVKFLDSDERVWFVLKEKNHRQIYELDTKPFCKKPSYAVYQAGKRTVITNELPEDGRYLIKRERR